MVRQATHDAVARMDVFYVLACSDDGAGALARCQSYWRSSREAGVGACTSWEAICGNLRPKTPSATMESVWQSEATAILTRMSLSVMSWGVGTWWIL